MKEINVFFFGDSICFGQCVSVQHGWVTRIAERLNECDQHYDYDIIVVNSSINGCTTRQALERMPYDIQSWKVDILTVQFGMNDCNYWYTDRGVPRISQKAFAANLEEIIERALAFDVSMIFLVTNHPTTRDQQIMPLTNITYQESNRRYNEIIREVGRSYPITVQLIDIEEFILSYTNNERECLLPLLLPDNIHLSVEGHKLYFSCVYPHIESAVHSLIAGKQR